MGQVSTFTIGDLVVPVLVEAYRANWFPTEDVLLAKTSSHKVVTKCYRRFALPAGSCLNFRQRNTVSHDA